MKGLGEHAVCLKRRSAWTYTRLSRKGSYDGTQEAANEDSSNRASNIKAISKVGTSQTPRRD